MVDHRYAVAVIIPSEDGERQVLLPGRFRDMATAHTVGRNHLDGAAHATGYEMLLATGTKVRREVPE